MRNELKSVFVLLGMLLVFAAPMVFAQSSGTMKVRVPFEFFIGELVMPPGMYVVAPTAKVGHVLPFMNSAGQLIALIDTRAMDAGPHNTKDMFEFNRYGDKYFLRKITTANSQLGYELPRTKREAEMAAGPVKPVRVQLAAQRR